MAMVLVATGTGCRVFNENGEGEIEFAGRQVCAITNEAGGGCLAVIADGAEENAAGGIWRRNAGGAWSKVTAVDISLQSIIAGTGKMSGKIFGGGADEAVMVRISAGGVPERLVAFDDVPGREEWFAGGPPLGVRSLASTVGGAAILAAVHVGGIPRSDDGGESWSATLPVMFDVHEVRAHPSLPNMVAAAAAVGLCVSDDAGRNWDVISAGLELTYSLALAVLEDEVLFAISDGPFAKRSQIFRWKIGGSRVEQVREGLPEWLDGKVDTAGIAASDGRAAVVDGGGNLWLSRAGSRGWERLASDLPYCFGVLIL